MLNIPAPLDQLGVTQELKAALLKLAAALPEARRRDEERIRQRVYPDSLLWFQGEDAAPHLPAIYRAVWDDRKAAITLRLQFGAFLETQIEQVIAPYGLVAKAGVWHIVAARDDQLRVYRASDVIAARLLDETFTRCARRAGTRADRRGGRIAGRRAQPLFEFRLCGRGAGTGSPAPEHCRLRGADSQGVCIGKTCQVAQETSEDKDRVRHLTGLGFFYTSPSFLKR